MTLLKLGNTWINPDEITLLQEADGRLTVFLRGDQCVALGERDGARLVDHLRDCVIDLRESDVTRSS